MAEDNQGAKPPGTRPPTLEDVSRLTPDSDFSPFTAPGVDAQVRNAALKKLFHGDPHFHQKDDLDVRVEDEHDLVLSPLARQQKIMQARALGMLDDDLHDQVDDTTDHVVPPSPGGPEDP